VIGGNQTLTLYRAQSGARDSEGRVTRDFGAGLSFAGMLHNKTVTELVNGSYQQVEKWVALVPPYIEVTFQDYLEDESGSRYRVETVVPRRDLTGTIYHYSCGLVKAGA